MHRRAFAYAQSDHHFDDERLAKTAKIEQMERDLAHLVVQTPYALLLAIPGINIVTLADLAGELGPIELYRTAEHITGRGGLVAHRSVFHTA